MERVNVTAEQLRITSNELRQCKAAYEDALTRFANLTMQLSNLPYFGSRVQHEYMHITLQQFSEMLDSYEKMIDEQINEMMPTGDNHNPTCPCPMCAKGSPNKNLFF